MIIANDVRLLFFVGESIDYHLWYVINLAEIMYFHNHFHMIVAFARSLKTRR
jgi:hypothetical protein